MEEKNNYDEANSPGNSNMPPMYSSHLSSKYGSKYGSSRVNNSNLNTRKAKGSTTRRNKGGRRTKQQKFRSNRDDDDDYQTGGRKGIHFGINLSNITVKSQSRDYGLGEDYGHDNL